MGFLPPAFSLHVSTVNSNNKRRLLLAFDFVSPVAGACAKPLVSFLIIGVKCPFLP